MTPGATITCPVCGAPREPGVPRCSYCGSWLVVFPDDATDTPVEEEILRHHITRFRAALDHDSGDVVALHGLGVALRSLGLIDDAIRVLTRAASRRPEALGIQRALAGTLLDAVLRSPDDARMWRDVRRQADRIIALDPGAVEGWRLLAEVALRTRDDAALVALAPDLASHDANGEHTRLIARLRELGDRQFRDWRWSDAVDTWEALAALDPTAGRMALVGFLLEHARLVPRSTGRIWRALRQTMALRGDFRQSNLAALALGVGIAVVVSVGTRLAVPDLFAPVTVIGLVLIPIVTLVVVRTLLVGWPPFPTSAQPWRGISTSEIVAVARAIASMIDRVRPAGGP